MPVVELTSPTNVFDVAVFHQLGPALRDFIATRRWFRAKTRTIQNVTVEDVIPANAPGCYFLITRIHYRDGESDRYAIDTRIGELSFGDAPTGRDPEPSGDVIATYRTGNGGQGNISTALPDAAFRNALLDAVFCGRIFTGNSGEWIASRTAAASQNASNANLPSSVSRAEQSNTSIIYSDRFILKLFRKIEPGINPDLEISEFLTSRGFAHTPAVLGKFEYRKNGGPNYAAGILQQFVPNRGDAWKYTLESLADFFQRTAAHGDPPQIPLPNPSATAAPETPELLTELLGNYRASADLLGRRTAQMHAALADPEAGPDFAPEPFTSADARQLCVEMMGQADIAFELLRRKQAALTGSAAENARAVLHVEQRVAQHFSALQDHAITAARIRFHGDYHLGQILYTGSDFLIIDFEGEPARPLSERRAKTLALRDVAGMLRSFQYAAYAALSAQPPGSSSDAAIEAWAEWWVQSVSAIYQNAYFETANGSSFVSRNPEERRILLDAFLLQKALYEVAYELNNRPDWVRIPLRGILTLVS